MANPEHLQILEQGVGAWNAWRDQHRDIKPDLSEADFSRAKLTGANLIWANLSRAKLTAADLIVADLFYADLGGADLTRADLFYADPRTLASAMTGPAGSQPPRLLPAPDPVNGVSGYGTRSRLTRRAR
jgi:hypothetical protein